MGRKYFSKLPPFKYQKRALRRLLRRTRTALLLEPGLGKTKIAVDYCGCRELKWSRPIRVVVVCPLSVAGVWENEWAANCPYEYDLVKLTSGSFQTRLNALLELHRSKTRRTKIAVINYDMLLKMREAIGRFAPDILIFDECHLIKTPNAKRTKAAYALGRNVPEVLMLTGTLITKNPLDVFSQMRMVAPEETGTRFSDFKDYYVVWGGFQGRQPIGWRHMDELSAIIKRHSVIMSRAEVLPDLPPQRFQVVPVEATGNTKRMYDKMVDELLIELDSGEIVTAANVLARSLRLCQITSGFAKTEGDELRTLGDEKMRAMRELLYEWIVESDQKVVIFCRFIWEIERLIEMCMEEFDTTPSVMMGSIPSDQRQEEIDLFQKGDRKVFIAQYQAGSLGITLTAASVAIFTSMTYNYGDFKQAQDRLHRVGQKNPVLYQYLLMRGTIDYGIYSMLKDKKAIAEVMCGRGDKVDRARVKRFLVGDETELE